MRIKWIWISAFCVLFLTCAKKVLPPPPSLPTPKTPGIKFVFVNRNGFRNDSTRHGVLDTVFQGQCLDIKFYDKNKNISYLDKICYNRNAPANEHPLKDSTVFGFYGVEKQYEASVGSEYQFIISLRWTYPQVPYTAKEFRYCSLRYPNTDTVKFSRDTVIKFVWPDDTASGNYVKTYQWP